MPADDTATTVANRYRLDFVIGSGGVGRVWRGEDTVLRRAVAVKEVPLPTHLPDAERDALRARVLREARAAARIHHPGSVQVFDVVDEADQVYLVMELVEEQTLADAVTADGPLTPPATAAIGVALLGALEAAHKVGIVHRDVKPRNVMVTSSGQVKLADFGIASMRDDPSITKTGMVMGTPSYMSPEQALGEPVGPPSDLWSTGALLYYAVEGQAPFDQGEPISTLHAVVHGDRRPFERAGELAPLIDGLLAKDPAARLGLAEATSKLADIAGARAVPVEAHGAEEGATVALPQMTRVAPVAATSVAATTPAPDLGTRPSAPRSAPAPHRPSAAGGTGNRRFPVAAVLGVVALLALGAVLLSRLGDDGEGVDAGGSETTLPDATATTGTTPGSSAPVVVDEPTEDEPTDEAPTDEEPTEDEPDDDPTEDEPATTTTAPAPDPAGRPDGVPAEWTSYSPQPSLRWTIWHPAGWTPTPSRGNAIDVRGPGGAYLRVDQTDDPGDDAVAAWEGQSATFAQQYPDYREIRIEERTFQGYEAAIWEYTYQGQRATNIGIIADDIDTGYALNFQAPAGRWDELEEVREAFEAGFTIPR